jgi:hypothetical protein
MRAWMLAFSSVEIFVLALQVERGRKKQKGRGVSAAFGDQRTMR